jgi:hypothetical protein
MHETHIECMVYCFLQHGDWILLLTKEGSLQFTYVLQLSAVLQMIYPLFCAGAWFKFS